MTAQSPEKASVVSDCRLGRTPLLDGPALTSYIGGVKDRCALHEAK